MSALHNALLSLVNYTRERSHDSLKPENLNDLLEAAIKRTEKQIVAGFGYEPEISGAQEQPNLELLRITVGLQIWKCEKGHHIHVEGFNKPSGCPICNQLLMERILVEKLRSYVQHLPSCMTVKMANAVRTTHDPVKCNCGFEELEAEKP